MSDNEIGFHLSGAYGAKKRRLMFECIRRMVEYATGKSEPPAAA